MAAPAKKVFCEVCGVTIPSASLLPLHVKGKKHQRLLCLKEERDSSSKRSIYVRGFKNSGSIEEELTSYFNQYGKGVYAIVEFATAEDAASIVRNASLPPLSGRRLIVKERSMRKENYVHHVDTKHTKGKVPLKRKQQSANEQMAPFLSEELIISLKSSSTVLAQVELLMKDICLTDEDLKLRRLVCQLLQEVFQEVYPQASVVPFGSTVSGVGWKGSDLDVCLLTIEAATSSQNQEDANYSLIIDVLRSFVPGCIHVIPVLTAKCPLLKFTHQPSGLSCDLSVNNRLGVANSDLLRCYMTLDSRVPRLVFIIRAWAKAKGITDGKQFSNYALTLMVLYFLQTRCPPVIPSLQQKLDSWIKKQTDPTNQNDVDKPCAPHQQIDTIRIENWDCSFFSDVARLSPSQNTKSLGELLKEYFSFYVNEFHFDSHVVNVRAGCQTSIASVLEELKNASSSEMSTYKPISESIVLDKNKNPSTCEKNQTETECCVAESENLLSKESTKPHLIASEGTSTEQDKRYNGQFKVSPVCVQDPFELSHNLTQNVPSQLLNRILGFMKDSEKICNLSNVCAHADIPNETSMLLELLTVPKPFKKRKTVNCHIFFVEYRNVNIEMLNSYCNVELTTVGGIFHFVIESFQKEFGLSCETRSAAKRRCVNGDVSLLTPAAVCPPGELQNEAIRITENSELTEENLTAICTAFDNTWTHCRRDRRRSQQKSEEQVKKCKVDLALDQAETRTEAGEGRASHLSPKQHKKVSKETGNTSPILIFELKVSSSAQHSPMPGCTVSMEHIDSKEFQLFGNFFSVYKKYFMGCLLTATNL